MLRLLGTHGFEEFQQALKGADFAKGVLFLVRNPRGVNTFIVVKKL